MRSAIVWLALAGVAVAQDDRALARDIFRELIEIDTATSTGNVTRASEAMAARLRTAGYGDADLVIAGPDDRHRNLVVRLHGTGAARPVLFNAHLDVVEARREDWSFDPFTFLERDGFFYGRGTQDDKGSAAVLITAFIRMKRDDFRPSRGLILALTADEEGGDHDGVEWLLKNRRDLIDAEFCMNVDSGGGDLRNGKPHALMVVTSEKLYHTLFLDVKNKGGHSSLPEKDNAINRLAAALLRVAQFEFPPHLSETTRGYFAKMAGLERGQAAADMLAVSSTGEPGAIRRLSASPFYNALLRTTCIATQVSGGHAENALPQSAHAAVNCRLLPGDDPGQVVIAIRQVVNDPQVAVAAARNAPSSPASPLRPDVFTAIERAATAVWPGVPVVPVLETGGTDGRLLRTAGIPTYGTTGMFIDEGDVRAHGKDERLRVESFYQGCEFIHGLARTLGAGR